MSERDWRVKVPQPRAGYLRVTPWAVRAGFPHKQLCARLFGVIGISGAAVGLILGGGLTEYLDWRWTMFVNLILAVPVAVAAVRVLPDDAVQPGGRGSTCGLLRRRLRDACSGR